MDIETWKIQYSGEINMLWDSMQTLMCDVRQAPKIDYKDFIAFRYAEYKSRVLIHFTHDEFTEMVTKSLPL